MGTNMNRYKDRDKGSRRLTNLAEFDMSVESVLAPGPGSLGLEDQVADIGMIVEDLVFVGLIISLVQACETYHIDDTAEEDYRTMKTTSPHLRLVMRSTPVLHNQVPVDRYTLEEPGLGDDDDEPQQVPVELEPAAG
jgi:hypothetical protein